MHFLNEKMRIGINVFYDDLILSLREGEREREREREREILRSEFLRYSIVLDHLFSCVGHAPQACSGHAYERPDQEEAAGHHLRNIFNKKKKWEVGN